jgi:hypothetical protein
MLSISKTRLIGKFWGLPFLFPDKDYLVEQDTVAVKVRHNPDPRIQTVDKQFTFKNAWRVLPCIKGIIVQSQTKSGPNFVSLMCAKTIKSMLVFAT